MRKPLRIVVGLLAVLGRILLCTVFLAATLGYTAPDVNSLAQVVAAKGAVGSNWAFGGMIAVLVLGSVAVIAGYKARFGAAALLAYLVLLTWLFQGFTFWTVVNVQARHEHLVQLALNLSIMGGMLLVVVNGPGPMSLDGRR